jgi:hypothetical protein
VSDEFLSGLREEPDPRFAEDLARRLESIDAEASGRPVPGLRPALLGGLVVGAASMAFLLPPVRAVAREFLDLFRVQRFAAVPVDTDRLARLERGVDLKALIGSQLEVIEPSVEPETVADPQTASSIAGIDVREPSTIPADAALAQVSVSRPGAFRMFIDTEKLRSLAEVMGVEDAEIPDEWDGAMVEVHAPPVVTLHYRRGASDFVVAQSRGPEVALPEQVDLAAMGALGLRIAGMSAEEARLFAGRIDWRSTLLVPIPAEGSHFREVEVGGRTGLLVSGRPSERQSDGSRREGSWRSVLLWTDGDRIFAASGPGTGIEVLEMARSIG